MVTKAGPGSQEEQGFNEKELADIMNEIENLEAEFDGAAEKTGAASQDEEDVDAPPQACEEDAKEEVVEEEPVVAQKPVPTPAKPKVVASPPAQVSPISKSANDCVPAQMEFHVQGDLQMNLKFYFGETWVKFSATPSDGLLIEMPGGMRFSLPVPSVAAQKSKKAS